MTKERESKRIPRKMKKRMGKLVITLDINAIPREMDLGKWLDILQHYGMALYDSSRGEKPVILKGSNKFKAVDTYGK